MPASAERAPGVAPDRGGGDEVQADALWIFGYGSIIWKPDFPFSQRIEGFIKNYRRVFYQGSTDHRGTPEFPGRTVTLEEWPGGCVCGAAYRLAGDPSQQKKTLEYLEWREKQYDVRARVSVFMKHRPGHPVLPSALTFIASPNTTTNVNYLGPAPSEDIAQQIARAQGPSGPNRHYLFRLAEAMDQMGVEDEELKELVQRVEEIAGGRNGDCKDASHVIVN